MTDLRKLKDKATTLFSKGKFEKSAEAYDEYCKADQKDVQSRLRLGDAWAKAGVKERAIAAYQWAAEGFAKEGFLPRAIAASKLVLELDPTHKGVQKMLADLYARKGGASKTARPGAVTGKHESVDLEGTNPPPRPRPAAATKGPPSPTNRADAIDLPEYEVPSGEAGSTIGGMSAVTGSSAYTSEAIVIEDAPAARQGPQELTETEIVLDTGVAVSGEVEVPIEGVEVGAPRPSAGLPMGEIVAEEPPAADPAPPPAAPPPRPAASYELQPEDGPLDGPLDEPIVPLVPKPKAEVVYSLDDEVASEPAAPAVVEARPPPARPAPAAAPTSRDSRPPAPPADEGGMRVSASSASRDSRPPAPPADDEGMRVTAPSASRPPADEGGMRVTAPSASRPPAPPADDEGGMRVTVPGASRPPAPPADDEGMRVTAPTASREARLPPQPTAPEAALAEEPVLLTTRRPTAELRAVPSAPDPLQSFASSDSAPPGLRPKKADAPAASGEGRILVPPAFAGSSASSVAAAPPAAPSSDLERSLQKFAEFDLESPPPPMMVAPADTVARVRESAPPAASPSGIARAPAAKPPPAPVPAVPPGHPSFTELELEGDTLFHEVSVAAARGLRKAGHDAAEIVEETMEAPEEARPDGGGLPRIPLFSDLPEDAFIALFERCPLRRKEPGESIIRQGTHGDSFFVICSGSVRVFREEGETRHELATLTEGTFFGEMALLSDAPRTASVEAASEDTQLLEISAPILKELSEKHATVAIALRKFYRQRLLTNLMNSAPIFKPFGKNDRRSLVEKFKARDVQPGDVIIREGTPSDGLYVVLAGEVVVTVAGQPVAVLKEGDIFGEMSLLTRSPGSATVASVRRTSLLRLPHEDFDQIIMSHPQILEMVAELSDSRRKANAALRKKSSATESML